MKRSCAIVVLALLAVPRPARAEDKPAELRGEGLSHLVDLALLGQYQRVAIPRKANGLRDIGTFDLTVWAGVETIDVPVFALHGTVDKATDPRGSAELVRRAHSADKTLKLYPGLYHDLVREPEKEQVMSDLETWLEQHAPASQHGESQRAQK